MFQKKKKTKTFWDDLKVQKCELIITVPANNIQYTDLVYTFVSRKEDIADWCSPSPSSVTRSLILASSSRAMYLDR